MKNYNLLDEILNTLDSENLDTEEILWVGSEEFCVLWENFRDVAERTYFSEVEQLPQDLVIVGDGWWLEVDLEDYGGFFTVFNYPRKPKLTRTITSLSTTSSKWKEIFPTLSDLQ
nr:MAG TPA: hypothetical protein [Caudoviricetes sp.]